MSERGAILLAGGLSQRMGAPNKLLLPIDGEPMIRRVVRSDLAVIDAPLVVVTGHDAEAVRGALAGFRITFAHNPRFAEGQPTSVAAGLAAAPETEDLLIGLGDQPLITPHDLYDLLHAHSKAGAAKITIPTHEGQRGNPIVVPRALRARLTENPKRPGCMGFTRDHPECLHWAALPAPGFYHDVDTPEAYAALVDAPQRCVA